MVSLTRVGITGEERGRRIARARAQVSAELYAVVREIAELEDRRAEHHRKQDDPGAGQHHAGVQLDFRRRCLPWPRQRDVSCKRQRQQLTESQRDQRRTQRQASMQDYTGWTGANARARARRKRKILLTISRRARSSSQ